MDKIFGSQVEFEAYLKIYRTELMAVCNVEMAIYAAESALLKANNLEAKEDRKTTDLFNCTLTMITAISDYFRFTKRSDFEFSFFAVDLVPLRAGKLKQKWLVYQEELKKIEKNKIK